MSKNFGNKYPEDRNKSNSSNTGFFQSIYNYLVNLIRKNPNHHESEINKKLNKSFNFYVNHYKDKINIHVEDPSIAKMGLINLLNDCYIVTFLQILFHTPNFLKVIRKYNTGKEESIINYLILVSEYPFNAQYFYELKQLLGLINPEYAKPWSNDSQEFGIDLINYMISETKGPVYENNNEINIGEEKEKDFINVKKKILDNYISTYQNKVNDLEKLFVFNQLDIFCGENFKNPSVSSNLHLELSLQKFMNYIKIENLIEEKYKNDNINPNHNQIIIKSKIVSLPEILIVTINRVLNNKNINNSRVMFNGILDLKNYIDYDLFNDNNKKTTYHLYAINECIHDSRTSHYICYIKIENKWFIFDDDRRVEEFYVNSENLSSPSVVGLFYKRDI